MGLIMPKALQRKLFGFMFGLLRVKSEFCNFLQYLKLFPNFYPSDSSHPFYVSCHQLLPCHSLGICSKHCLYTTSFPSLHFILQGVFFAFNTELFQVSSSCRIDCLQSWIELTAFYLSFDMALSLLKGLLALYFQIMLK